MGRAFSALIVDASNEVSKKLSALPARAAVAAILVLFVAFVWLIAAGPPLVTFALTVSAATAWCLWLAKHPGSRRD